MQISVEKLSNVQQRLIISVPMSLVEEEKSKQLTEVAKKANLPGFRPGKASKSVIEQRFGEKAQNEAMSNVIQRALGDAIQQENLRPLAVSRVEPKMSSASDKLEFVAYIEVYPQIESVHFDLTEINKPDVVLTEEDVDRVMKQLTLQHTKWKEVTRGARLHDRLVIDYYAIFEGVSDLENKVSKFALELGSQVMIPGFEEALIGAVPGEQRRLSLHFPENFQLQDKAGKPVEFVVDILQVFEGDAPLFNADFIRLLGIESGELSDFRAQIRTSIEQELERLVSEKLKEQVFGHLLEKNIFELPESLVKQETRSIHDEVYRHEHDHSKHSDAEWEQFKEMAQKRVTLSIILAELVKQHGLKANEADVKTRIQKIAALYQNPNQVEEWLSTKEQRRGIELQILEDQVLEQMIKNLHVNLKKMSYAELKGLQLD